MASKPLRRKKGPARHIFLGINFFLCSLVALCCLLPILHILAVSLSSKLAVFSGNVVFWPVQPTLDSYRYVLKDSQFFIAYSVTIRRALMGWSVSLLLIVLAAYPLSLPRHRFPARRLFMWYFVFTMLFNGGMIPTYLVVKNTGLIDSLWALVLPCAVPAFYMILMVNFFKSLPEALFDAAYIDGASHPVTLVRIVLPISLPALASISLFILLGHWNDYFMGMIYINSAALKPLQTYLRSIIIVEPGVSDTANVESLRNNLTPDATNGAKIFLGLLPIMVLYPFLQKYFAKGIVRGSVKE